MRGNDDVPLITPAPFIVEVKHLQIGRMGGGTGGERV